MRALIAVCLCACMGAAAQDTAPQRALQLVDAKEAAALRRVIAAPLSKDAPADALRAHFVEKENAAIRLGDRKARERIVRQAIEQMPNDARWPNQLAAVLEADRRLREALAMYERASQAARTADTRVFFDANAVRVLAALNDRQAEPRLAAARQDAQTALESAPAPSLPRVMLLRALTNLEQSNSSLQSRRGRLAQALPPAREAHRQGLAALDMARQLSGGTDTSDLRFAANDLASAQQRLAAVLRDLERDGEAEAVLQEHLRTLAAHPVSAGFAAGAHSALGALRMAQRQWAEAATQYRLSLQVLDRLGLPPAADTRLEKIADLSLALLGQGEAAQARALFDALYAKLQGDAAARKRARLPFPRALVAMANAQWAAAAALLEEVVASRRQRYGVGHYLTAQAQGLQGAALWRAGSAASRERGAELLRQAVLDLRAPRNADHDTERGLRPALRGQIQAAYVDAMSARGGLAALWAMGVADGLRGGVTHQALADAALRASTGDPELAALARHEQDARREWQAAEQLVQAPELNGNPAAQAQLRSRLSELALQRQQLQHRLRERFPGYEQMQRPQPPDPAAVAERLQRNEQLLMLLPTEQALLVWLVSPGELPHFQRIELTAAALRALVQRVLDGVVLVPGERAPAFDAAAAHEIYRRVLAPLAARLKAPEVVIAASGVLAPLPWAVLLTEPRAAGAEAAWLVRRHALVQVPSVASWLSLRQAPRALPAPEPLLAWGDPQFGPAQPAAPRSTRTGGTLRYADIPPLPETRDELLAIAQALAADPQRDLRLGAQATRGSVLQASADGLLAKKRVVLFATHGLVAGEVPGLRSPALAMAAPPSGGFDGGLLTLDDVLGLKLNADWVVLSACNTAAADGRAEEMLSGLARGFFYAGSRSVLVTQWAVETESAKRLTTAIFEHHARVAGASKAASLRHAMLQVMAMPAYAHPTFWAPYILVGDSAR